MRSIKKKLKKIIDGNANSQLNYLLKLNQFTSITETQPQDIFIAGFPKSGNTWMQNLIAGAVFAIDTAYLPDTLTQELVPDVHSKHFYKRFHHITFFKSHDLPKSNMKRVVHLVRDGRDAMASYYAMQKSMKTEISLEDMIVDAKGVYPARWHEHTRQWIDNPFKASILVVTYEDLLKDTLSQLKRIMNFAGIERNDETLKKSIIGNSFEEMKRKERELGWNNNAWDKNEDFIRKGKVNSYKNEISNNLIEVFENRSRAELEYFNYINAK